MFYDVVNVKLEEVESCCSLHEPLKLLLHLSLRGACHALLLFLSSLFPVFLLFLLEADLAFA